MKTFTAYLLFIFITSRAFACCMVPETYKGSIGQDAQEAVLIHHQNREELVLRINYRITGNKMPDNFAWVITTPTEPDSYALADPKLFADMFNLSQQLLVKKSWSRSKSAMTEGGTDGVELGKHVNVGPYDIQPIRGVGPNALQGLNKWLSDHQFPTEEPNHMNYFVENNFTFLCIRISPTEKKTTVASAGMLPPLHLSFETLYPYYPLRFSSRQGVFDLNIHMLTKNKLNYETSAQTLSKINWTSKSLKRNITLKEKQMPQTLKQVFEKSTIKENPGNWKYNNIRCSRVNQGNTIKDWKRDVYFITKVK